MFGDLGLARGLALPDLVAAAQQGGPAAALHLGDLAYDLQARFLGVGREGGCCCCWVRCTCMTCSLRPAGYCAPPQLVLRRLATATWRYRWQRCARLGRRPRPLTPTLALTGCRTRTARTLRPS